MIDFIGNDINYERFMDSSWEDFKEALLFVHRRDSYRGVAVHCFRVEPVQVAGMLARTKPCLCYTTCPWVNDTLPSNWKSTQANLLPDPNCFNPVQEWLSVVSYQRTKDVP